MRVLVVEDHVVLADRIAEGLRDAGLAVDVVNDGAAALTQAGLTAYDVLVLDRDLPVVHGDRVSARSPGWRPDPDAHLGRRRRRPGRRAGAGRRRLPLRPGLAQRPA
jgi:CheY-like chemotaxis protein